MRDLALALKRRGHSPAAFSTRVGSVAGDLSRAGIPVTDDLDALPFEPDVIHGQHHMETMRALLHFPGVPAVYFCHGARPWVELPPRFPRIRRYVAVDTRCRRRVAEATGIAEEDVVLKFNFVDLDRFKPRGEIPSRPRRGVVFSNTLHPNALAPIRRAFQRAGIELDLMGRISGRESERPEERLGSYDIVLAKARAALEAMAVGAAVVLCDQLSMGPLVTSANFDALRPLNFGEACLNRPLTAPNMSLALSGYDPVDAARVSRRVRSEAGLEETVDHLLEVYRLAIENQRKSACDAEAESKAAAEYMGELCAEVRRREKRLLDVEGLAQTLTFRMRDRILRLPIVGHLIRRALVRDPRAF